MVEVPRCVHMLAAIAMSPRIPFLALLSGLLTTGAVAASNQSGDAVDFSAQIRPILSAKCFLCHGPDEGSRKGKLRLDSFEEATKARKGHPAITPGHLETSELVRRILTTDVDDQMPPAETKNPLKPEEIDLLKRWVAQGGKYTPHWAWVKPVRSPLPAVQHKSWPGNGIDRFVLAQLEHHGLKPAAAADRHTLLRRLSLDLTGLPPTPAEVDAFVNDSSPQAYEQLVDRLLASPHFGERWARVWLDLARYADSAGYGSDPLRPNIWPWRDWLINALNRNEPFDEFTRDLIAGDLLPNATAEQQTATAFHRNTMTNTEGGTEDEEWRVAAVKDRAAVTAQVWMGLTMGCAQCHTHKFDPIAHREYYSFYAFFNQSEDNDQPDERPTMALFTPAEQARRAELESRIATVDAYYQTPTAAFEAELAAWGRAAAQPVPWRTLVPSTVKSSATNATTFTIAGDGSVLAGGASPAKDTYTVSLRTRADGLTAFRLETLADDSLPGKGPGRKAGEGNFVLQDVRVTARTVSGPPATGRFVRIEAPGPNRRLTLAEVQVFSRGENIALRGTARQSSTSYLGDAARAIDGNTEGNRDTSDSVTHTETENDAWWEVDLGGEFPVDEVAVWNRTGEGVEYLANTRLLILDSARKTTWTGDIKDAPKPAVRLGPNAARLLPLRNASADYAQNGFNAGRAIDAEGGTGWAVGGRTGESHALAFELAEPLKADGEVELTFTFKQDYGERLTLGRFRLSATAQPAPVTIWPSEVQAVLAVAPERRDENQRRIVADFYRPQSSTHGPLARELEQLRAELAGISGTPLPIMRELPPQRHRVTHLLNKGNYLAPGEEVTAGVPAAFNSWPAGQPTNRLGLAAWLTAPDNPLTARVQVNRVWAQLMGQAFVETEEDFGTQGTLPTNQKLLDWLAVAFETRSGAGEAANLPEAPALGWDFKALVKLIVMSSTYRQSSVVSPELLEQDPRNKFYSRAPRRRLDAEAVRDQALALSGLLSPKVGGPSVYPLQPDGLWRAAFNGERSWRTSEGEDRYRRGLYTFWRRTVPYPSMTTFDAPSREACTFRRLPTDTPLQAFVTLNDPVFVECAQALGRRIGQESGSVSERIRHGLERVLAHPADAEQVSALVKLYEAELASYRDRTDDAAKLATDPLGPLPPGLSAAEAAAWTTLGNVLLNLDGVLSKG
ncbi:MAG TPA: DUF1549 domain-containing protein [Candidatus Limnocylindria bacterium]|nr:DUF1549 domain-containing protein [Candidatus Limnocylindria bacterium]